MPSHYPSINTPNPNSSDMTIKNVVLVGAAGLVGQFILRALATSPSKFNITLLSRPISTSKQPDGYPVLKYAFDDPDLVNALRDHDIEAIVCAVSSDATSTQLPLIDAAVKAGVKHFVPTEYASDTLNSVLPTLISWYKDKRTVHDRLDKVAKQNPGFRYTGIISGPFLSWGISSGFLGYDLKTHTAKIYEGGGLRVTYSEISQVALAVSRALERQLTGYFHISSITTTQLSILSSLTRLSGSPLTSPRKWTTEEKTTHEAHEASAKMMESCDEQEKWEGSMLRAMRWVYGADCGGEWGYGDNERFGLEEGELDKIVEVALRGQYE